MPPSCLTCPVWNFCEQTGNSQIRLHKERRVPISPSQNHYIIKRSLTSAQITSTLESTKSVGQTARNLMVSQLLHGRQVRYVYMSGKQPAWIHLLHPTWPRVSVRQEQTEQRKRNKYKKPSSTYHLSQLCLRPLEPVALTPLRCILAITQVNKPLAFPLQQIFVIHSFMALADIVLSIAMLVSI